MALTQSQEATLNALHSFIFDNSTRFFRLSGAAGSGKSYVIGCFLANITNTIDCKDIAAVAPSHKAKNNLKSLLGNDEIEVRTVASFLGLAPDIDPTTGKELFISKGKEIKGKQPEEYELVIIDEAWMIDAKTVQQIIIRTTGKVIFVGDNAQLSPIEDSTSWLEVPKNTDGWYSSELTEVVRYSGDLARIAHSNRVAYSNGKKIDPTNPLPLAETNDGSIVKLTDRQLFEQIGEEIKIGMNSKVIAYTNNACKRWNQFIRTQLFATNYYESKLDEYNRGDLLIARKPISRNNQIVLENSTEFTIKGNPEYRKCKLLNVNYIYWDVQTQYQGVTLKLLSEDSRERFEQELERIKSAKNWKLFYWLLNSFDDVVFNYAITCHKSQGSTLDAVYLDVPNLMKCTDKYQILYTAMTRSKQAYIF